MIKSIATILFGGFILVACTEKKSVHEFTKKQFVSVNNQLIERGGFTYQLNDIKECGGNIKSEVFEMKEGKKIVLLQLQVYANKTGNTNEIIPAGATLTDKRGNSYENQPGLVAVAQSNRCIEGDDLKSYNKIWKGNIEKGEILIAYALAFEVPVDFAAEKFYWNNHWKKETLFFKIN